MVRIRYRLKQMWWDVAARPVSADPILELLTPPERALFARFSAADQQHAVRVAHHLEARGATDPDLLRAALLHDIGKTCVRLTPFDRTLQVILTRLARARTTAWGTADPTPPARPTRFGWRTGLVCRRMHPLWGAVLAARAGCGERVVELIRRHQEPVGRPQTPLDRLLSTLQWADEMS